VIAVAFLARPADGTGAKIPGKTRGACTRGDHGAARSGSSLAP
jgi:hypothetical protein